MKYFKELIKLYRRLTEQAPPPATMDPAAVQQADELIGAAMRSGPGTDTPIPEHPGKFLHKSQEGNITLKGLGPTTPTVQDINNQRGEGYEKLVSLLASSEGQAGIEDFKQGEISQRTLSARLLQQLNKLSKKLLPGSFEYLKRKFSMGNYTAGKKGVVVPLEHQLNTHTSMVIQKDGTYVIEQGTNEKLLRDIPEAVEDVFEAVAKLGDDATQEQREEVCQRIRDTFSIVKNEGISKVLIKKSYKDKTEGLIVVDKDSRFSDSLNNLAAGVTPGCKKKVKKGPNKCCALDEPTHILSLGLGHGNSVNLRGAFMEHFHVFAHQLRNCDTEGPDSARCTNILQQMGQMFEGNRENLVSAFQAYAADIKEDELSIDASDENSIAFAALRAIFGEQTPRKVLLTIMAATRRGLMVRKPEIVINISAKTRLGRRGDVMEGWSTREAARDALLAEGIPEDKVDELILEENISSLCAESPYSNCPKDVKDRNYFVVNISLKNYISLSEKVKLGTISTNTIDKLLGLLDADNPEEKQLIEKFISEIERNLGIKLDLKALRQIKKDINDIHAKVDELGPKETIGPKGTKVKVNTLDKFADTLLSELKSTESYKDYIDSDLVKGLRDFAKKKGKLKGDDLIAAQTEIKEYIKIYLETKLLTNKMKNKDDPKGARNARIFIATTIFGAGGASDRSLFLANELSTGKSQFTDQNSLITDHLKEFIDNDNMSDDDIDNLTRTKRGKVYVIPSENRPGVVVVDQSFSKTKDPGTSGAKTYTVGVDSANLHSKNKNS